MSAQRKTRVAVFVSGGGTNLQALIDARDAGQLPDGEIALVVSNKKDAGALDRARRYDIPARYLRRKDFAEKLEPLMREFEIDMIVLAGFLCILPEEFTRLYPRRMINIHPALIPSFCGEGMYGLHVHEAALRRGVKVTGATVHFVNEICDGGEILLQKAVDVLPGDTPESLQLRVMQQAEWKILPMAAEMVAKEIRNERI
ncbi:MAG: phosphoribosylglycinamide formyltransferase [Eubacteriales bacterium]|nr:phosphoribosylglycinamide formyltransferase [Eubacteriales bacterium]MDY2600513.1 phosphoribosylglycinamide formyltransferase [Eubacteriales bacterium]